MRHLTAALILPAICLPVCAGVVGRASITVKDKDGKNIPGAKVTLHRMDISWAKELRANDRGEYLQVGLEPRYYYLVVEAEGYPKLEDKGPNGKGYKIIVDDIVRIDVQLLTAKDSRDIAIKEGRIKVDESAQAGMDAKMAFNDAVKAFNAQDYSGAFTGLEGAVAKADVSITQAADATAQAEARKEAQPIQRLWAVAAVKIAATDEARRPALLAKAEPLLQEALDRNAKDDRALLALVELSGMKGDAAGTAKYQAALDKLMPPDPAKPYNDGVTAFNAGDFPKAKTAVLKAIAMDPKFAKSYWLLGVVEFSMNNLQAAVDNFEKCLAMDPTGEKAGECGEFLKDPTLAKLKNKGKAKAK